jgi:hypothetical protein
LRENWKEFWDFGFLGELQRRGVHVSTPEIGSRGEEKCSGGTWGFHAELRRESCWGNLIWVFFGVVGGKPRGFIEEGGHLVCFMDVFRGI